MKYPVAFVGSSGGGRATLSSGESLLPMIRVQLRAIERIDEPLDSEFEATIMPINANKMDFVATKKSRRSSMAYEHVLMTLLGGSDRRSSAYTRNSADILAPLCEQKDRAQVMKDNFVVDLHSACFVDCKSSMDLASENDLCTLWKVSDDGQLLSYASGPLKEVNIQAEKEDVRISKLINEGVIKALICVSSDPNTINRNSIHAAVLKGIPILGTGGKSMSIISTLGGIIIGNSGGSVATSSTTSSICFASALACHWKLNYYPPSRKVSWQSIAGASLPLFLVVAIVKVCLLSTLKLTERWASTYPAQCAAQTIINASTTSANTNTTTQLKLSQKVFYRISTFFRKISPFGKGKDLSQQILKDSLTHPTVCTSSVHGSLISGVMVISTRIIAALQSQILPTVVSAIACAETCTFSEISMLSGAAAGALVSGSLLAAVCSGVLCGLLLPWLLVYCARLSLLPTATSIVTVGGAALVAGMTASTLGPWLAILTGSLRTKLWLAPDALASLLSAYGIAAPPLWLLTSAYGFVLGWLVSWGSEQGYYHSVMLPLIILEMELGDLSVAGSFDLVCLCMPCAGICLGVWILATYNNSTKKRLSAPAEARTSILNERDTEAYGNHNRHAALGRKGFISCFFMGDYVEACYPYLSLSPLLLYVVRMSCSVAGTYLTMSKPRSSAYIPLPLALLLAWADGGAEASLSLLQASLITFFIPFLATLFLLSGKINKDSSDTK